MKKVFASILLLIGLTASLKSQNKTSILRTPEKRDSVAIDSLIKAAWNVARTDAPQSLSILGQLSNIFDNVSTLYRQDVLFYYYGVVYKNLSRFAESERYLNKYEELHAKTDNKVKLANVNMVKANLFSDQGLWEKSMASVTKSLLYYEQLKDTIGIIRAASKLGYLLTEINRPEDAMKYHKRALHYAQIKKDSSQLSVAFTNIAVVFEKMKKFDSAFHYYANSKNINDQTQSMYGLLYDNFNIGNIYLKKEQLLEAEPYIKKALDLAYQLKIPSEISACRLLLADLYLTQGKTTEGIKQIESELSSNEYPLSLKDQMQGYRSLYEAYKKEGKADQAILNLEKYKAVNDSMVNENTTNRINQLEIQYQTATKEKEIALLNSKNELNAKEIQLLNTENQFNAIKLQRESDLRKALSIENALMDSVVEKEMKNNELLTNENNLKNTALEKEAALKISMNRESTLKSVQLKKERQTKTILIIGSSLLLMAALSILLMYKRQKSKSAIIEKQSEHLQILMKEIHHRVKNNLQVISSLLDLQSLTISDNQASEAVKEGKNRVQSMALIHQNLYSEGNIKGIRAKEYVGNLLQSLCDSYNITTDKVKVNLAVDDLNLDVDTMIPLGLVLNELVSNSLKYAFKNGKPGELSILLKEKEEYLFLKVSDNGVGYPEGLNAKDSKSFGMKMIRAFAQKLKAKLDIYNNNGAVVEMQITKYSLA